MISSHCISIIGAIIIAVGLYSVAWGKSKDHFGPAPSTTGEKTDPYQLPILATENTKLVIEGSNYDDDEKAAKSKVSTK